MCGMLTAFFFRLFLFWLAVIAFGVATLTTPSRTSRVVQPEAQPA